MWIGDLACEVCGKERAVGVASSVGPVSFAYGRQCLRNRAEPEWLISFMLEENGGLQGCNKWFLDCVGTYLRGKYLTVREYDRHRKLYGK